MSEIVIKVATTPEEVGEAQRVRRRVFVEEQGIPAELDADGLDHSAVHVLCRVKGEVVATGRLVIGKPSSGVLARIAVLPEFRGHGFGCQVVRKLETVAAELGLRQLVLHPHRHLERFYLRLGYNTVSGISMAGEHELISMQKIIKSEHAEHEG